MKIIVKAIIVVALLAGVSVFQSIYAPLLVADVGVNQLENSDAAFAEYSALKKGLSYLWVLYILIPVVTFLPELLSSKNKKQK